MQDQLQNQTDQLLKAITSMETTLHQDLIMGIFGIGVLLVAIAFILILKR